MPNIARLPGGARFVDIGQAGTSMPTVGMVNGTKATRSFNNSQGNLCPFRLLMLGLRMLISVATLVGELLQEIMVVVNDKVFDFHHDDTVVRARSWLKDGLYTVLLAYEGSEPVGFLALYQSYALYTEGAYGTIPEFYVRPAVSIAMVSGLRCCQERNASGRQRDGAGSK